MSFLTQAVIVVHDRLEPMRSLYPSFSHEEMKSKFTFVSIGRVADNKRLDSDIVEVYIGERYRLFKERLLRRPRTIKQRVKTGSLGESYNDSIKEHGNCLRLNGWPLVNRIA